MVTLEHLLRSGLSALTAYAPAPPPAVRLDANESPFPLPDSARQRLAEAITSIELHRYPDARANTLRAAVARHYGCAEEMVLLGCGSDEIISLLMLTLCAPRGDGAATVLFPTPTFVMYRMSAITHGLYPVAVPLDSEFELDVEAMSAALDEHRPNLVFLATPNNPTGNCFELDRIRALIEHDPGALFIIDEAYAPFSGRSIAPLVREYPNVGLLGTLSKVGFAAARVGWVIADRSLAHEIDKARQPYNLSTLAQTVGTLAFTEFSSFVRDQVEAVQRERARLSAELATLPGFTPHPSDANFVLVKTTETGAGVAERLRKSGIGVRSFSANPRLEMYIRITVGTREENDLLLQALRC